MPELVDQPKSIFTMIMEGTADYLSTHLITNVVAEDTDDPTAAGLIRSGKLQADPTKSKITLLLHPFSEGNKAKQNLDDKYPGLHAPSRTLGNYGEHFFRVPFLIELKIYIKTRKRSEAREIAMVTLSRTIYHLLRAQPATEYTSPLPNIPDEFGTMASMIQIDDWWLRETGGEGMYIWNGEIWFATMLTVDSGWTAP